MNLNLLMLKNKFIAWALKWSATINDDIEQTPFDGGDMLTVLQALGFQLRYQDACDPKDVASLKNGERGLRIVLNCLHSGHRFFLEKPTDTPADPTLITRKYLNGISLPKEVKHFTNEITHHILKTISDEDVKVVTSEDSLHVLAELMQSPSLENSLNTQDIEKADVSVSDKSDKNPQYPSCANAISESLLTDEFYSSVKKAHSDLTLAISRVENRKIFENSTEAGISNLEKKEVFSSTPGKHVITFSDFRKSLKSTDSSPLPKLSPELVTGKAGVIAKKFKVPSAKKLKNVKARVCSNIGGSRNSNKTKTGESSKASVNVKLQDEISKSKSFNRSIRKRQATSEPTLEVKFIGDTRKSKIHDDKVKPLTENKTNKLNLLIETPKARSLDVRLKKTGEITESKTRKISTSRKLFTDVKSTISKGSSFKRKT